MQDKGIPDFVRRTLRVIRMVSELHRMGYQQVRFMPHEYPLAFRIAIGPASLFSSGNGAELRDFAETLHIQYSSASETAYFDWTDARSDNARQLAEKFAARFPAICLAGKGRDWAYAGWLLELIGVLEATPGALPLVMDEYSYSPDRLRSMPFRIYSGLGNRDISDAFPLPPPKPE
jgi:hypothetical protein